MVVAWIICCLNFRDFNCSIASSVLLYIGGVDVSAKSALSLALPQRIEDGLGDGANWLLLGIDILALNYTNENITGLP